MNELLYYDDANLREFDATAEDGEVIRTGERVRVIWTQGDSLVVERIQD